MTTIKLGANHRRRWLATMALPMAMLAGLSTGNAGDLPGRAVTSSPWSGIWLGTTPGSTGTSLTDIRGVIGASTGTGATLTGQGVGVALIDTGVAPVPGMPAAQVVNGPDLSFESQSASLRYLDTYGHGTHMAGVIIGNDTATGTKGLAPRAKLTSVKIGTSNGAVDASQLIAAIDWVVAHRNDDPANPIRVINLSYGVGGHPSLAFDPMAFAVENAWRNGIVVVAAAGNNGGGNLLTNPATHTRTIAVGSQSTKGTVSATDDDLSTFTNLPPVGGRQPDVLAPGESVMSLRDPGSNIDASFPTARVGETLFRGSGTSQAAAVTSAAVALLLQYRPSLTPDQVKSYILASRTMGRQGLALENRLGFLNVNAAIAKINAGPAAPLTHQVQALGTGSLQGSRGASVVIRDGAALYGENTIFGPFDSATWAQKSAARTAWAGGVWMGQRFAGDGWTGASWASRTWAPATWAGTAWNGASWVDPNWSGRYWSGRYWSSGTWSGRYWSSDDWSSTHWN